MTGPDRWCPKYLREVLCQQQTYAPGVATSLAIGDLIRLLDVHRPLGPDGKHGDRHTPTCGCVDTVEVVERPWRSAADRAGDHL